MKTDQATLVLGDLEALTTSWLRHLRAANLSPKTIKSYREAAEQMTAFLINKGMPTNITSVSGEHVEAFVIGKMERTSAATAATRYRGLQQFFGWLVDEGEITTNLRQHWSPAGGGSRAGIGRRRP